MKLIHRLYARISPWFRRQRLCWMQETLRVTSGDRLIDIGGYPWCWPKADAAQVTLVNLEFSREHRAAYPQALS